MTTTSTVASCGRRGVKPVIARRCIDHGSGLGRVRSVWASFAWLHNVRRLRIRWERDAGCTTRS